MACSQCNCDSTEARKAAYDAVKHTVDAATLERIEKGLPVEGDNSPEVRTVRQAWARYHERTRSPF